MMEFFRSDLNVDRNSNLTFQENFKYLTRVSKFHGTYSLYPKDHVYYGKTAYCNIVSLFCFYILLHSLIFYDIKEGKDQAFQNGFMCVIWFLIMTDYWALLINKDNIKNLILSVNEDYENAKQTYTTDELKILEKYVAKGIWVSKLWVLISIGTASMFPIKAIVIMIYFAIKDNFHLVYMIDVTLPKVMSDRPDNIVYFTLFFIEISFALSSAMIFTVFPPMGPILMVHACGRLEVLENRLMNLHSGRFDEQSVQEKLRNIVYELQKIYIFVDKINVVFQFSYEVSLKNSAIGIPFNVYQLKHAFMTRTVDIETCGFLAGNVMHTFVPCLYSDYLEDRGSAIEEAVYACGWEGCFHPRNRKMLVIMLLRAARPPVIRSIFRTLSLQEFGDTCKSAYTLFNMMTLMWD